LKRIVVGGSLAASWDLFAARTIAANGWLLSYGSRVFRLLFISEQSFHDSPLSPAALHSASIVFLLPANTAHSFAPAA